MVDRIFSDPRLAALYDLLAPWGEPDDAFYFELVMDATTVLDVGCGTGLLLREARKAGHTGRLTGLDPAQAMLDIARERTDIEWVCGDLSNARWDSEFELIVMTGHGFQVLLSDADLHTALVAVRRALANNGRFAFETRNPAAKAWESWTPDRVTEITDQDGNIVRFSRNVDNAENGERISFTSTVSSPTWDQPLFSQSRLLFLDCDRLDMFLAGAGLTVREQYGDWDRSPLTPDSPEIIIVAGIGRSDARG